MCASLCESACECLCICVCVCLCACVRVCTKEWERDNSYTQVERLTLKGIELSFWRWRQIGEVHQCKLLHLQSHQEKFWCKRFVKVNSSKCLINYCMDFTNSSLNVSAFLQFFSTVYTHLSFSQVTCPTIHWLITWANTRFTIRNQSFSM